MDFGLMFFASGSGRRGKAMYRLLLEAARFGDEQGFAAIWTPERHFHEFGGPFPNPAVTSAALAATTTRIQIRAGSLVAPLHDTLRIAEEWAVVDNLSDGRAAISFGSGWNVHDFVFFPDRYRDRQRVMYEQIALLQRLWAGQPTCRPGSDGELVEVRVQPLPVQQPLPIWVTSSGNVETFRAAGRIGAHVLTHLLGQDVATLANKIAAYREARSIAGHDPAAGKVALMLHTFLAQRQDDVRERVRLPLRSYLRSAVDLEQRSSASGGVVSGGKKVDRHEIDPETMEELLDIAFERYLTTASLLGSSGDLLPFVRSLARAGVDEIACLIDFGVSEDDVIAMLPLLADLRRASRADERNG
jgi:natural product biosynthesis luciferase-like monooxygenase protein